MRAMKYFLFIFVIALNLSAQTCDWYCDQTNGNDANDCSNGTTELCKLMQRCFDVASGGDTICIANTAANVLEANFNLTAFTENNNIYTFIKSWDNGGSLTIQRPDESVPRVAAVIDGANAYTFSTQGGQRFVFKDIKFQNFNSEIVFFQYNFLNGVQFYSNSNTGGAAAQLYEGGTAINILFNENDSIDGFAGTFRSKIINGYFHDNNPSSVFGDRGLLRLNTRCVAEGNIFEDNTLRYIRFTGSNEGNIINGNSFKSTGAANVIGIEAVGGDSEITNNIFYNFDGSGSKPINTTASTIAILGHNAFYDSNASTLPANIGIDLTANDVTGTGDPFVDSANGDYTPSAAALKGAALSNPNSSLDIGAVQSAGSGGGGGSSAAVVIINE